MKILICILGIAGREGVKEWCFRGGQSGQGKGRGISPKPSGTDREGDEYTPLKEIL